MEKHIVQILLEAFLEEDGPGNRDIKLMSYSGRSMYGKECLAVTGFSGVGDVAGAVFHALSLYAPSPESEDDLQDLASSFKGCRQDSLGHDKVVYFPDVKYVEGDTEEEDDADD